jgi:hypothetical protein
MTKQCPHCGGEINVGALLGSAKSKAKTRAARANAKLGGWPKGKKRGKRPKDANQIAHGIVAKAERLTRQGRAPQRLKVLPSPKAPKRGH